MTQVRTTEDRTWIADGHTVTLVISSWHTIGIHWTCPFDPLSGDAWPFCRLDWDEAGMLIQTEEPLSYCNVGEYVNNMDDGPFDALELGTDFTPERNPFPVEYAWEPTYEVYQWRPVGAA